MHRRSGQLALDEAFGPFVHDRVVAEPCPKRVRARADETWVLDSVDALLAWIEGPTPDYAVPVEDVDGDVLAAVERETDDRLGRVHPVALEVDGERTRAGVRVVEPPDSAPRLADHVVLDWDAVDAWFVEEERQRGHPGTPTGASTSTRARARSSSRSARRAWPRRRARSRASRPGSRPGSTCPRRTCAPTCSRRATR